MMAVIQEKYNQLNTKILKITEMKYFNEIYAVLLALVTILGWKFSSIAGMIVMVILATAALILTKDLKYVIPNCIYFIFMFSEGFANDSFPMPVIVSGGIFAVIMLIYSFKDGIHIKNIKSLIGLAGLAITSIIPIIWCRVPKGNEVLYFLFFGNLGYLLLYLILSNGIKDNGVKLLAVSMSYLAIVLTCECAFKVYELKDSVDNILKLWYYMGWGLCNEAGILICLSIPFIFYLIGKQENLGGMLFQFFKLLVVVVGLILTTSRGSYLFGFLELGILSVVLLFVARKGRLYQNLFLILSTLGLILIVINKDLVIKFIKNIQELVFTEGLDDNGRTELWVEGYQCWKKDWKTILFGSGATSVIRLFETAGGWQDGPVVFHSTLIETLVMGGVIGLITLGYHLLYKFYNLKKYELMLFLTVGIGFFIIDIYGLIDNTYHMYYFMLPLAIIMAVIDTALYQRESLELQKEE